MKFFSFIFFFLPLSSFASDCSDYQFDFHIEQKTKTKSLKLCSISPKSSSDFVSPSCLDSKCKQLKPRKITLIFKRKGVKAHPGFELCKALNGQYISGQLRPLLERSSTALCIFNDGNIVSSGYLYSSWKKYIER